MAIIRENDTCVHNLSVQVRSGVNVVNVKPLFNQDSQNIIIACGRDIKVFSIKSGKCIHTLKYHTRPVVSLRENKRNILQIFSCSDDGVVVQWDYTGRLLKVYNLQTAVTNLYIPSPTGEWFVTRKFEDQYRLYSLIPKTEGFRNCRMILKPVLPRENSIDFGFEGKYIASIYENNLTVYKRDTENIIRHKTGERKLMCVVCHPTDLVMATGDDLGRVIVWSNAVESNHPIRSIYHWHTLPVSDLAFSPEGSHILSGGGEAVLVKWNLFSEEKSLLPRMGAPIVNIVSSKDNNYVLTTHRDNVLQVVDAQRHIVQVIQGLTLSEPLYGKLLPAGLLYSASLKTLVMNGKPGHLQFFDIKQEKLLYNLDIVAKNFLSRERDSAIYNIDVQKAALDHSGLWLATTEYWCTSDVDPRIWLKFWKFDLQKQMFTLNTNVLMPHDKEVNDILFQPCSPDNSPLVITTSQDKQFKMWTLICNEKDGKETWGFESLGSYKDLTPSSATFSEDGSIVAVAFERVATLWNVEGLTFKDRLFSLKMKENIRQLLFGCQSGFKYLLGHDGFSITAWDCLTLSVSWIVHIEVQLLIRDDATGSIAAFCKDQNLKIFKPDSPVPLDYVKRVSDAPIVSALFVSSDHGNNVKGCFQEKSQLFFIDKDQKLLTLAYPEEEQHGPVQSMEGIAQHEKATPFKMLQATQAVSDVKKGEVEPLAISKESQEANIITNPTWQDMSALFHALVPKLLIPKERHEDVAKQPSDLTSCSNNRDDMPLILDDSWQAKALSQLQHRDSDLSHLASAVHFTE